MGWRERGTPQGTEHRPWYGGARHGSNPHRRMATTQESRFWDSEFGRPKRSPAHLPNAWDDLMRGDLNHRSWKHYRRIRWRNIAEM